MIMLPYDFFENLRKNMDGSEKEYSIEQCQLIINQWRLERADVPNVLTAKLLHDFYNGMSAKEVMEKMGRASRFSDILDRYNWLKKDEQRFRSAIDAHCSGERPLNDETLKELRQDLRVASEKAECLWWSLNAMCAPLTQIYTDTKSLWVIDIDRV